jgi:pimeloyl-ACP methyl ester carboxylesterase
MGAMRKIYILHGWTYSTDKWQDFIKFIKMRNFIPVMLNVPGLTEKTNKVWTLDDYVEWLKDALSDDEAIIIGHSNGGRVALAFAAKYPDRLKLLILIDSAGIYHNELPIRVKRLIFGTVAKLGKKLTSSEKLRALLYKTARENDYKDATPQMRETMANLISTDLTSQLSQIIAPTTIVWGEKDKSTPLSDGKLMHKLIKNSRLFVIKDAWHSPQFTHINEVCQKILSEIEKL